METILTQKLVAALFERAASSFALDSAKVSFAKEVELVETEAPAKAALTPLPYRLYPYGGVLREGASGFVWRDAEALRFVALMQDSDVYSDAGPKGDRTWKKGDVMELFLQTPGDRHYYELHIAPNAAVTELKVASIEHFMANRENMEIYKTRLIDTGYPKEFLSVAGDPFHGWAGLISVPLEGAVLDGRAKGCLFGLGRYNYNHAWGAEPEISSSFELGGDDPTLHCPPAWHKLV